jgi:hypothetical protein
VKANRAGLDILNKPLTSGQPVRLVTASPSPSIGEAEIIGRAAQPCSPADQHQPGLYHFKVKVFGG